MCSLYISAVVGAGFATGQELMHFFARFGILGFWGVAASTVMFCILGSLVLRKAVRYDVQSPGEMAELKFGKPGANGIRILSFFMQFTVFVVMLAGLRTLLERLGIPGLFGTCLLAAGVFLVISSGMKMVIKVNSIITPIVIAGITATCILLLVKTTPTAGWQALGTGGSVFGWLISSLLYGSFNSLLAMPALCAAGKITGTSRNAVWGGTLGGLLIGGMAMLSYMVLCRNNSMAANMEMPIVELATGFIPYFGDIYQIVIFAAMAGSAVICARCTADVFSLGNNRRNKLKYLCVCLAAVPLSMLDFSGLIGTLYPFFGAVGILAVVLIVC